MDFGQLNPRDLYGISGGGPRAASNGGGGQFLPRTDAMAGDGAMIPWSPDSPIFWFVILGSATALGIIGASLDVRAGKRHASVKVGD
jgi:hypothetical protein